MINSGVYDSPRRVTSHVRLHANSVNDGSPTIVVYRVPFIETRCTKVDIYYYVACYTGLHVYCSLWPPNAPTSLNGGQPNLINNIQQRALPISGWAAITLGIGPHSTYLWSPYVIGRPYIFSCCGLFFFFFMVALCNRADHYIFILFLLLLLLLLLLLSFFSSPNLSSRRLDVYHTSAHGVVLV